MVDPTSLWVRVLPSPYPALEYPPYPFTYQKEYKDSTFSRLWDQKDQKDYKDSTFSLLVDFGRLLTDFGRLLVDFWSPCGRLWSLKGHLGSPMDAFSRLWRPKGQKMDPTFYF